MEDTNKVLLEKGSYNRLIGEDKPWVKMLKCKYLRGTSIRTTRVPSKSSWQRKAILGGKDLTYYQKELG